MKNMHFAGILIWFFYASDSFAACQAGPVTLQLDAGSPAACSELGIEGDFVLDTCEDGTGHLSGSGKETKDLRSQSDAWFYLSDAYEQGAGLRLIQVLWLDPKNQQFSYASSSQDSGGTFRHVADCKGSLR